MNVLMIGVHADDCDILASGLIARYGERGRSVRFAEAYEVSEYGSPLTEDLRRRLFPY